MSSLWDNRSVGKVGEHQAPTNAELCRKLPPTQESA
jgi:hypothetical protein